MDDAGTREASAARRRRNLPYLIMGPGGNYRRCYRLPEMERIRLLPWLIGVAVLVVLTIAAAVAWGADPNAPRPTPSALRPTPHALRPLFSAIRQVESGGDANAIGDKGRSLGPYQIQLAYWVEGGGRAEDYAAGVRDRGACERVMIGYWRRYCPRALAAVEAASSRFAGTRLEAASTLARVHNGGPAGARKRATLNYWRRVKAAMTG